VLFQVLCGLGELLAVRAYQAGELAEALARPRRRRASCCGDGGLPASRGPEFDAPGPDLLAAFGPDGFAGRRRRAAMSVQSLARVGHPGHARELS
jgi:hypothetical protein